MRRPTPLRFALSICLLLTTTMVSRSQDSPRPADPLFRAMTDELRRSVSELQFKDLDKPYFIQYIVLDQERYRATATFGALSGSVMNQVRYVQAQVRVGDYDFDNTEFVTGPGFQGAPPAGVTNQTVIDNDYNALRHALWLATDASYKQAVEQLARKRAFVQNKVRGEQIPDFSKESPITVVGDRRRLQIDKHRWEKQVREWSALFKDFPEIAESAVILEAQLTHRYLVNSEGTHSLQPTMLVSVEVDAGAEAPDGMRLRHWIPFNAGSLEQLPPVQEITKADRKSVV